jgi:hypothetical protein
MPDDRIPGLLTLNEFRLLTPREQGYVSYMQGDLPGSELKEHQANPYPKGSREWNEFIRGQCIGVQVAQDSEE